MSQKKFVFIIIRPTKQNKIVRNKEKAKIEISVVLWLQLEFKIENLRILQSKKRKLREIVISKFSGIETEERSRAIQPREKYSCYFSIHISIFYEYCFVI